MCAFRYALAIKSQDTSHIVGFNIDVHIYCSNALQNEYFKDNNYLKISLPYVILFSFLQAI